MRFLILSFAALACAAAAPSHLLPYAAYSAIPALPYAALPTVPSGDIQGAVIDAHVKAADFAQATVDKARYLTEQAVENVNTQVITNVDQAKERLTDAFWANEDKKWQVIDALKTAEAQIDGDIASKAEILAKTAVGAPYVAAVAPVAPVAPIAPVVYSGYVAPALNSFSTQTIVSSLSESAKVEDDSEKVEAAAKTAEPAKDAEAEKDKTVDAADAAVKAAADLKAEADKALAALKTPVIAPVAVAGAIPYTAAYPYSGVAVAPAWAPAIAPAVALKSGLQYASTIQHVGPFATSTVLKSQW